MDKKQKEDLVTALLEKGETYREITKRAGVSPNTVKAVANKMGLDQNTSVSSRALELYVKQKTPLQVAIELDIKAEDAMHLSHSILHAFRNYRIYKGVPPNREITLGHL